MPNRMLRDWTDSLRFDGITAEAERLFVRLIMRADDYGRFHAEPRLIKANCFPLIDHLRPPDILRWLDELSTRGLILRYETDSRSLLAIVNFGQRLKQSRPKFPPAPGEPADWLPVSDDFREVPGSSGHVPLEEKGREYEDEARGVNRAGARGGSLAAGGSRHGPTDADLLAEVNSLRPGWQAAGELNHLERTHFQANRHILAGFSAETWQTMRDYMSATLRTGDSGWQPKARVKFLETPGDLAGHAAEWQERRPKRKAQPSETAGGEVIDDPVEALKFFRAARVVA